MNKIMDFLKSETKAYIYFGISALTFFIVFFFGNLKMDYYFLGIEILFFLLVLYLFSQYFIYKKDIKLTNTIEELEHENKSLQNQIINDKKDLEEYFLLWIHQIKTPITVAKLLLSKDYQNSVEELKTQLFYIEEYSNMATNYLKLKDRQADMDITSVNLDNVIKLILKKYSMLFINKNISLEYEPINEEVISDAKWLSILIEQIISNAIKYTEKGKISITFHKESNTLKIRDTGIGIRSEDLNKIFDRGYSGFNGRLNEKSSGLGLYLVKNIAHILNIEVKVSSILNEGSAFSIIFKS